MAAADSPSLTAYFTSVRFNVDPRWLLTRDNSPAFVQRTLVNLDAALDMLSVSTPGRPRYRDQRQACARLDGLILHWADCAYPGRP